MYVVKVNSTATNDGQAHFVRDTLESATALAHDLDGEIYECLPVGAMLEVEQLQMENERLRRLMQALLHGSYHDKLCAIHNPRFMGFGCSCGHEAARKAAAAALGGGGE